jgi:hypothetical protein
MRGSVFMFCSNCGTKLEEGHEYCSNCGTRAEDVDLESPGKIPRTQNLTTGKVEATGGLKVWLIFLIVSGIIGIIYCIIEANYFNQLAASYGDLGDQYSLISSIGSQYSKLSNMLLVSVPIGIINVIGAFRLLKGYKNGFYIICICCLISFIATLTLGTGLVAVLGFGGPVITWLLAREQWKDFQ